MKLPIRFLPAETDAGLVNSWYFLVPFGLICVGVLIARALGYIQ